MHPVKVYATIIKSITHVFHNIASEVMCSLKILSQCFYTVVKYICLVHQKLHKYFNNKQTEQTNVQVNVKKKGK